MTRLELRELAAIHDLEEACSFVDSIWQPQPGDSPLAPKFLKAMTHVGSYVAAAYQDGVMVGISVAFLSDRPGPGLHSHITGATPGSGAGLALKRHQREWALERELKLITWTYDPLVRRNAHFNLAKLGARPEEYLPSFYGVMDDGINNGDDSDRIFTVWHLTEPRAVAAVRGEPVTVTVPQDAVYGLSDRDGLPVLGSIDGSTVLIAVPGDIETLRRKDPKAVREWRVAVREVLGGLMADGARVTAFHDKRCYVVERDTTTS